MRNTVKIGASAIKAKTGERRRKGMRRAAPLPVVLTIGHSTRTLEEFVGLLRAHGATRVGDVRTVPRSWRNPQFNKDSLPEELKKAGLGYMHLPGLGGPVACAADRWPRSMPEEQETGCTHRAGDDYRFAKVGKMGILHFRPTTGWRCTFPVNKRVLAIQLLLPHQIVRRIVYHIPSSFSDGLHQPLTNHLRQEKSVAEGEMRHVAHRGQELVKLWAKSLIVRQQIDIIRRPGDAFGVNFLHQIRYERAGNMPKPQGTRVDHHDHLTFAESPCMGCLPVEDTAHELDFCEMVPPAEIANDGIVGQTFCCGNVALKGKHRVGQIPAPSAHVAQIFLFLSNIQRAPNPFLLRIPRVGQQPRQTLAYQSLPLAGSHWNVTAALEENMTQGRLQLPRLGLHSFHLEICGDQSHAAINVVADGLRHGETTCREDGANCLKRRAATGTAMPLCWSHAEYISLVRSRRDGVCFGRVEPAYQRHVANPVQSYHEIWSIHHPLRRMISRQTLRIILAAEVTIVWTRDDWKHTNARDMKPALNLWFADVPTGEWPANSVLDFTFFWKANQRL